MSRLSGNRLAVVVATVAAVALVVPSAAVAAVKHDRRYGGADRYETAAQLFAEQGNRRYAVIASGEDFPDALSGAFLARNGAAAQGKTAEPTGILLTRRDSLPQATLNALFKADVATVFILGGTGSVSKKVENTIKSKYVGNEPPPVNGPISVIRLAGSNRYDTNRRANLNAVDTSSPSSRRDTVIFASGQDFPDALGAGPLVSKSDIPLILTGGGSLSQGDLQQLDVFQPTKAIVIGGTSAISSGFQSQLTQRGISVTRLGGANRQETAARVAAYARANLGFGTVSGIGTGLGFADALAAGPTLGKLGATLLLSRNARSLSSATLAYLAQASFSELIAIGGTSVVSDVMMDDAAAAAD